MNSNQIKRRKKDWQEAKLVWEELFCVTLKSVSFGSHGRERDVIRFDGFLSVPIANVCCQFSPAVSDEPVTELWAILLP